MSHGFTQMNADLIRVNPRKSVAKLISSPAVDSAFRFFETNADAITEEQIRICSIPASPFGEQERAEYFSRKFSELGLAEILQIGRAHV